MQNVLNTLKGIYPLKESHLNQLLDLMERVEVPKNHRIIHAESVEKSLFFIEKGIARAFCEGPENQITFWFGKEGDIVFSYNSYINGLPGYESVEVLEHSVLYEIKTAALATLFQKDVEFANWGRKLAEQELIKTEERLIARLFKTAAERYRELLNNDPALIQRIQLGYIASYLGVTQVTLSRIRAEVR
ncbi:MAG: Crp/Fnr family transcriptional regulator [Candidatus Pedobacter colombiensis]|uniref:Crp/Fnr family transcriptional regulator n=1 Tax=Candidatus Pedobacter colombiensis TaxID=3121371 RepID=A0AAJ6B6W4_9SPHI|nr:Crp/Fnr family transcriptional regulator [Pedobacter sp.]WEK19279.1 MAG: Crp/Fnr family transcriptional regulator [Pedobacter sp.]